MLKHRMIGRKTTSKYREMLLFELPQKRPVKISARSDEAEKSEKPWLQPIWRDSAGKYHYARFDLVYRYFSTHKIHELVFNYVGQHEVGGFPGYDRDSGHKIRGQLDTFLRDGWPQPEPGGHMTAAQSTKRRTIYDITVYCDDLFLCAKCGRFHPHNRSVGRLPWVRDDDSIDHAIIRELVKRRRNVPEFRTKSCNQRFCRELRKNTIERMKCTDEARARAAAFNAELQRTRAINIFPESLAAKKRYIYAVQSGRYVKIGVASDVTKRVLALQTS